MTDEHHIAGGAHRSSAPELDAETVLARVRSAEGRAYLESLDTTGRDGVRRILRRALVDSELQGNFTTPDLMSAFEYLGGRDSDLDDAVLTAAALRTEETPLSQAGLAVVWSRLIRVEDRLSEGEVRSWLSHEMICGLAAKSVTWTRFASTLLADWARQESPTQQATSLAGFLAERHPDRAVGVLAQALRDTPGNASALFARLQVASPKTLARLTGALVEDPTIPASFRIRLAGQADDPIRARARAMVARELGVDEEALAQLAPDATDDRVSRDDETMPPAYQRFAWNVAAVAWLAGCFLSFGFRAAVFFALVMVAIAYLVGRGDNSSD